MHCKYSCDEAAFDEITNDSAYWMGFLMADGYLHHRKGSSIIDLRLQSKDQGQLVKFKKFLKSNHKISHGKVTCGIGHRKYPYVVIQIHSKRLVDALARHGIVPYKKERITSMLEQNKHFWRGMLDGDGTVRFTIIRNFKMPFIRLVGTLHVIQSFQKYVQRIIPRHRQKIGRFSHSKHTYFLNVVSAMARELLREIYSRSTTYLERKYKMAHMIMNQKVNQNISRLLIESNQRSH